MITLDFELNNAEKIEKIHINTGTLTGYERHACLKDALESLSILNPCVKFKQDMDAGEYEDKYSEDTVTDIADISNTLSLLWDYTPEDGRMYINCLQLFENAVNMILCQQNQIYGLMDELAQLREDS
ncbi:MAG: hypothetical protein II699_00445 [Lachnospiraceae bacterium]|nr:hypothetical protein [Lachnospiraceae bacterium]